MPEGFGHSLTGCGWLPFDVTVRALETVLDALLRVAEERDAAEKAEVASMYDTPAVRQRIDDKLAELHRPDIYDALSALTATLAGVGDIKDALASADFTTAAALVQHDIQHARFRVRPS
jgi:hypothetical protein